MSTLPAVPVLAVVYAKDIEKVANFYRKTLSLSVVEETPGFVVLGNTEIEVAVIRMRDELAQETVIAVPPHIRESNAIKCSFLVGDLQHAKTAAEAAGGGAKALASAWHWRGQLHLDGYDPEGNVVQFRQCEVSGVAKLVD